MTVLLESVENSMQQDEIRYKVYHDDDDFYHSFCGKYAIEFASNEEEEQYRSKFESGEISAYGIEKMQLCKCCCVWSCIESSWGIHAETPHEALDYFKQYLQSK